MNPEPGSMSVEERCALMRERILVLLRARSEGGSRKAEVGGRMSEGKPPARKKRALWWERD